LTNYLHCSFSPSIWWRLLPPWAIRLCSAACGQGAASPPILQICTETTPLRSASVPGVTHASLLRFGHVWQSQHSDASASARLLLLVLSL
jgi:hypothetical protein